MAKTLSTLSLQYSSRLAPSFYKQSTLEIAQALLGKVLVRKLDRTLLAGRIVETEAYIGETDPACHAFRGETPRTRIMYGPPGHAYVYFTYGMHFMLNVVTEEVGFPAAVLVRALEPLAGFDPGDPKPTSGPGKLCRAMSIDKSLNGVSFRGFQLWIGEDPLRASRVRVRWSPRIGISVGQEHIWRAYIYGNPHVSRKSNPADPAHPSGL